MISPFAFISAKAAVGEMLAAGAEFYVRRRDDSLRSTVAYRVRAGGDIDRCKAIIAAVKARPKQFGDAFRSEAAATAFTSAEGSAP